MADQTAADQPGNGHLDEADAALTLGSVFPERTREDWRALVDGALKGADFDKALTTRLAEGITLQPIYAQDETTGVADAVTRNAAATDRVRFGWDVRSLHAHPDLKATNSAILADLERGATSIILRFDRAVRSGRGADGVDLIGQDGVAVQTLDQLDATLADVFLEAATVALQPGASFVETASLVSALLARRGVSAADARGHLGADPLGTLAAEGRLRTSLADALTAMGELAKRTSETYPNMTAVSVDTSAYHAAGADEAMDLAYAMATGVCYLRAMETAGLEPSSAAKQIQFTLTVGVDVFLGIAKIRAARRLWARILEASDVAETDRTTAVHATMADRVVAGRDAWVNILRGTVAAFAAGVGGADSVTVSPYTHALGLPDGFARRVARNTQVILLEESHLAQVIDPAGGSWYVEHLTDALADAAWTKFQEIEAAGGMADALLSGSVAQDCAAAWSDRERQVARRRIELTGVNSFPKVDETPVDVLTVDRDALVRETLAQVSNADPDERIGASDEKALEREPLPAHRLGEAFEALRDACDAMDARPKALLVTLGTAADYTARATFTQNYLASGGIESETCEGDDAQSLAGRSLAGRSGDLAVICSSDTVYEAKAGETARALKAAGVKTVILAGRPGEREQALRSDGVDLFIHAGDDTLATLRRLLTDMGVL